MKSSGSLCVWLLLVTVMCFPGVRGAVNTGLNVSVGNHAVDDCQVFCNTKLLHYIQMARIFNDSGHFVHMKLKQSSEVVEKEFDILLNNTNNSPSKDDLTRFVEENFGNSDTEFEAWIPEDWIPRPKFIHDVYDLPLRNWAQEVIEIWKSLGRKLSKDVLDNNHKYSQIYVPNPFIIPGGRFTELYYWDSYWIIEGLLLSEMYDTAKNMIENFFYLVHKFGYVPNGTRKYYLGRSQPPFLIPMVDLYFKYTKDLKMLKGSVDILEKEFDFWWNNRSFTITMDNKAYRVFQYKVDTTYPRPESYYEDEKLTQDVDHEEKIRIYSGLKSAAESGWDFSSRWFLSDGKRSKELRDINTMSIAPVCLNSLMGLNAQILSEFFGVIGDEKKQKKYRDLADESNVTMSRIFWSDRDGVWLDYNVEKDELLPGFYPSNLMPLWTESYGKERSPKFVIEQVIAYLDRNNISSYPGGIPTSLMHTGQQWDLPSAWAPLQYFIVLGLHKASKYTPRAGSLAHEFAQHWVLNVYQTYLNSTPHAMFEKYSVTEVGKPGGGGEYQVQKGFGWTNAVVIKFLSMYGHKIRTREVYDPAPLAVGALLMVIALLSVASYTRRVGTCHKFKWDVEASDRLE